MSEHHGRLVGTNLLECVSCGFKHLWPLPKTLELQSYYGPEDRFYGEFARPDWLVEELNQHKQGLWNARYLFEEELLPGSHGVIDMGAGAGHFVTWWNYQARHRNTAWGIEPSARCRQASQTPFYLCPKFLPHEWSAGYDLRASLVLEHLGDPYGELKPYVDTLLDNYGRFVVCVPNEFNPLQKKIIERHGPWFVGYPHINYFDGNSLVRLMRRLGLRLVYEGATFPIELFWHAGLDYIHNDTLGRRCFRIKLGWERCLGPLAFRLYGGWHRRWGWGRELLYVFRRRV